MVFIEHRVLCNMAYSELLYWTITLIHWYR